MNDDAEMLKQIRNASLDTMELNLKVLNEVKKLFESSPPPATRSREVDGLARRSQQFLYGLARLQLEHFDQVLKFTNTHVDLLVDQLRELGRLGGIDRAEETKLKISAAIGQRATGAFTILNLRATVADLRFTATDFRGAGGERIAAPISVTPTRHDARATEPVGSYEDRRFDLTVPVAASVFRRPGRYSARVYAMHDDVAVGVVDVTLQVSPVKKAPARRVKVRRRGR